MYSEVKLTCYYITTVYKGVGKGGERLGAEAP